MEKQKRKLWLSESMEVVVSLLKGGDGGLQEAARLCNALMETLKRHVEDLIAGLDHPLSQQRRKKIV